MARWFLLAIAVAACACPGKPASTTGTGSGTGAPAASRCEDVRGKVEALYRGEAAAQDPARARELVADNTTMALNDCAKAPARVTACIARVTTVAQLEQTCLVPLDEEGTEGEALRK